MNPAKKIVVRTQKFVTDHKIALTAVTTATATAAVAVRVHKQVISEVHEFLKDHDLYEEFQNRFENLDI